MIVPLVPMPSGSTRPAPRRIGCATWCCLDSGFGAVAGPRFLFWDRSVSASRPTSAKLETVITRSWVRASRSAAGSVCGCGSSDTPRLESVSRSTYRPGRAWRDHDADVVVLGVSSSARSRTPGNSTSPRSSTETAARRAVFAHGVQDTTDEMSTEPEPGNPRPCLIRTVASLARGPQFVIELSVLAAADHPPCCRCF